MKKLRLVLVAVLTLVVVFLASCGGSNTTTEPQKTYPKEENTVYFAAPLFNQSEREYNLKVVGVLEKYGYKVFLPQRDGFLAPELEGLTEDQKIKKIFDKDYEEVKKADIIFVLLDGRTPDEGACIELGIAYESGKRCYGFKTDARSVELDMDLNPMIKGCFIKLFYDLNGDNLLNTLEEYLKTNNL